MFIRTQLNWDIYDHCVTTGQEHPRSPLRNYKEKKRKPGIQRPKRQAEEKPAKKGIGKKNKEGLEQERDVSQILEVIKMWKVVR